MRWSAERSVVSALKKNDPLLSGLAWALAVDTILGVVTAVVRIGSRQEFQGVQAWIRLVWVILLGAMLLRSLRRIARLWQSLSARQDHLDDVARTSHEWLWETTDDLFVISCSQAVTALLGRLPAEMTGRMLFEFVASEDRARAAALLTGARTQSCGWEDVVLRWRHAEGHPVSLQGSAVPILNVHDQLVGFRGTWGLTYDLDAEHRTGAIRHRIRDVLASRSIVVAFQPIVRLDTGTWVGVEALTRFPDQRSPAAWIAEAHEVGLGIELELKSLEVALTSIARLPKNIFVALNASPELILSPGFANLLSRQSANLDRLVLEITEHFAVTHYDDIRAALARFRERGLRLAVDDTGAGFASFNHVLRLRPDIIKLDRSLVTEIHTDPARRAFVRAVVLLALELDATVTAEGVESPSELAVLMDLGVHHGQGYLFDQATPESRRWDGWRHRRWLEVAGVAVLRERPTSTWLIQSGHHRL